MFEELEDNALYVMYRDDPQGTGREAFDTLTKRHWDGLRNFILDLVKDRSAAEDLAQNIFLAAMQGAHLFDETKGSFGGWIYSLARKRAKNVKRDRFRRPLIDDIFSSTPAKDEIHTHSGRNDDPQLTLPSREAAPEYNVDQTELIEAFWSHVNTLDEKLRDTVVLSYVQDLPQKDVARILGVNRGTVMRRLAAVMPQLRELLGEDMIELTCPLERRKQPRRAALASAC